ncbi:ketol-acid reductoisomerase, partial [Aggregatibacter actinomycetemcomitans serotype d str. SA508]
HNPSNITLCNNKTPYNHPNLKLTMNRLSNSAKLRAFELAEQIKEELAFLFAKHMNDIISGEFSRVMMEGWAKGDANLLKWREETGKTAFENAPKYDGKISEQEYFDNGELMVAMVKDMKRISLQG